MLNRYLREWVAWRRSGRRQFTVRSHLLGLALVSIVPLFAAAVFGILSVSDADREIDKAQMGSTSRAISAAIDLKLRTAQTALMTLATFVPPAGGDLSAVYAHARMVAGQLDSHIILADLAGNRLFDTRAPLGAALTPLLPQEHLRAAVTEQRMTISDLFYSGADLEPKYSICLPLFEGDGVDQLLVMSFPAWTLSDMLASQRVPARWFIAIADRQGIILARNADHERLVGTPAGALARRPIEPGTDAFMAVVNTSGVPTYLALSRSSFSGWTAVVGIPQSVLDGARQRALHAVLATGIVLLLVAFGVAYLIGRHLSGAMAVLASRAQCIASPTPQAPIPTAVREVNTVAAALERTRLQLSANERSLRRGRDHLARAQRVATIGSWEYQFETGAIEWSDEMYRIWGLPRDEPMTIERYLQLTAEQVLEEDRGKAQGILDARPGEPLAPTEYRIRRADGAVRVLHREAEVTVDRAGKAVGIFGVTRDVTELREAEGQRDEFQAQLHQSQKMEALGTLAGGVAHDLNNTLVPVIALSKAMLKAAAPDSPEWKRLELINDAGRRAADLVRQIVTFARRSDPESKLLDPAEVANHTLKLVRSTLPATISLTARIGAVPLIAADEAQLHQVILNLVTNAAQAIGEGMGSVALEIAAAAEDRTASGAPAVRISVSDTGCGMDEATRQRIFEPFFTTKGVGEGTGLGLSVVHGIVSHHGGSIRVASEPGRGTRFDVLFPVADPLAQTGAGEAA
jgi:PAS domain S-box-containing protein